MRIFFWFLFAASLVLIFSGLVVSPPDSEVVFTEVLGAWYRQQTTICMVIGVVVGGLGAALAMKRLRHEPGKPARSFLEGVAGRGVGSGLVAVALAIIACSILAASSDLGPLSPSEKLELVMLEGVWRALAVFGAALFGALLAYAITSRLADWGGRYSVLSHKFMPRVS